MKRVLVIIDSGVHQACAVKRIGTALLAMRTNLSGRVADSSRRTTAAVTALRRLNENLAGRVLNRSGYHAREPYCYYGKRHHPSAARES